MQNISKIIIHLHFVSLQYETLFFSGIDGTLYINGLEQFASNDNYCLDYFYSKDDNQGHHEAKVCYYLCSIYVFFNLPLIFFSWKHLFALWTIMMLTTQYDLGFMELD